MSSVSRVAARLHMPVERRKSFGGEGGGRGGGGGEEEGRDGGEREMREGGGRREGGTGEMFLDAIMETFEI